MDASAVGATRRCRVSRSFSLFSLARLDRAAAAQTIVDDFWFRRGARRDRLVDGGLGPLRAGEGLTVLAGVPSDARLLDLRRRSVDGGGPRAARGRHRPEAHSGRSLGGFYADLGSDLSRRTRVGDSSRSHLRYLATNRRGMGARVGTPLLRCATLAQFLRKHAHGAVRPSYAGLCAGAPCFAACRRRGAHGAGRGGGGAPPRSLAGRCFYANLLVVWATCPPPPPSHDLGTLADGLGCFPLD